MVTLKRLSTRAYAAGLAAALMLGGCGTEGETPVGPTPVVTGGAGSSTSAPSTATPSTATTSTSVDPVLARIPAAARPATREGALAYVTFYFASLNEAFKTADGSLLGHLSKPECKLCTAMLGGVDEIGKKKRRYSANFLEIHSPRPVQFTSSVRTILVDVSQRPVDVLAAGGEKVETIPPGSGRYVITLDFSDRWIITRIQEVK